MTRIRFRSELLISMIWTCLLLVLTSCGGSGPLADGGIGGTGVVSVGSVTGLGSIKVNGVHYLVTGASYTREDAGSVVLDSEAQTVIKVGMVVEVDGELNVDGVNGQSSTISYEDVLEGNIENVALLGGAVKVLTILKQQVIVENGFTKFNGVTYAGLDGFVGSLEVSGFRLNDGRVQATYVENRVIGRLEVKGIVTTVNTSTSFDIGSLNVQHSAAITVVAGDLVEVKGSAYTDPILTATTVSIETDGFSVANKDEAEIEGFVSGNDQINVGDQFLVRGQAVTFSPATQFIGGSVADLVDGAKVEAEGRLTAGVLAARKITIKEGVRLEADIASIDTGNGTLTLAGLPGVTIIVAPTTTELNGTTGLTGASPLSVGNHIRIRGQETSTSGTVLATRLDLRSASADVELRGPVEDDPIVPNQITILGISVNTAPVSIFSIEEDDGTTVTATNSTDFFNRLVPSEIVKLKGTISGFVTWTEAQKQNEP